MGKRSCAASIPNRWSATSRHGTTLSPSIIRTNKAFVADYRAYAKAHKLPNADTVVTNDRWKATRGPAYVEQAVTKAGTTDVDKVREAMAGADLQRAVRVTLTDGCHQPPSA